MEAVSKAVKLTKQQQRVLKLLFKFRFVSCQLLADVMGIRRESVYEVLEHLVKQNLVTKVYKPEYRIVRRPAYYYLNKTGVTTVRKLMVVKESVVHALYKNDVATEEFIQLSLKTLWCYSRLAKQLPEGTELFAKAEINRFSQFPKNRPDIYLRTPEGREAMIVVAGDKPAYIIRKRLDEIITHSEDEGWDGDYPTVCFILKDQASVYRFLYGVKKKLEGMGVDDDELIVIATFEAALDNNKISKLVWSDSIAPKIVRSIF